jgi:hypothetical protein
VFAVEPPVAVESADDWEPPVSPDPVHAESTQIGATTVTGAATAVAGPRSIVPICPVTSDPVVDCPSASAGLAVATRAAARHAPRISRRLFMVYLSSRIE